LHVAPIGPVLPSVSTPGKKFKYIENYVYFTYSDLSPNLPAEAGTQKGALVLSSRFIGPAL
jgi:hypothetical protein